MTIRVASALAALCAGSTLLPLSLPAQFNDRDRRRGETMLEVSLGDVKRYFWDEKAKGLDLDSLTAAGIAEIRAASSNAEINGIIARAFFALDDSHTKFFPPGFASRISLGWSALPMGDSVYVVDVKRNSPADSAGLRVGDRIVSVGRWQVERGRWADLMYVVKTLQRPAALPLTIQRGEEAPITLEVPTILVEGRRYYDLSAEGGGTDWYALLREEQNRYAGWDARFQEVGDSVLYWRLRTFSVEPSFIRESLRRARGRHTIILDLSDNRGGLVVTLQALIDRIARADQVGDTVMIVRERTKRTAQVVENVREGERFAGKLIVLVDAGSMSASEAFADAVQRLERGTVLGDRTAGYLTMSLSYSHATPGATSVFYGASIAMAMLERPDGSRIERVGVIPDELITPSGEDLAARRDPVLARALQMVGQPYDPLAAFALADHMGTWVVDD